ncbi:MAG TPA: hypothetical protein VLI91_15635, partial [Roseiarcus sp.]|nr:hypothetical protein [Roseiarcus sp.]
VGFEVNGAASVNVLEALKSRRFVASARPSGHENRKPYIRLKKPKVCANIFQLPDQAPACPVPEGLRVRQLRHR